MISPVTAHQPAPTPASAAVAKPAASPAPSQPAASSAPSQPASNSAAATVQISNAAQAALKETLETQAQTAREAAGGDHQAQRLLAKEVAAEKS